MKLEEAIQKVDNRSALKTAIHSAAYSKIEDG